MDTKSLFFTLLLLHVLNIVTLGKKVQRNFLRNSLKANKWKVTDPLYSRKDRRGKWVKCENGQRKKGLERSLCVLKKDGEGNEQEFTFQEYLLEKECPKFGRSAIKAALVCYADQNPCKEYEMEELVAAFEGCNKIKTVRDNKKNKVDAGQNAFEKPDRTLSHTKPKYLFNEQFSNIRVRENMEKLASWASQALSAVGK